MNKPKSLVTTFLCFSQLILLLSVQPLYPAQNEQVKIIPEPVKVIEKQGEFVLDNNVVLVAISSDDTLNETIKWFSDKIATSTGIKMPQCKESSNNQKSINLILEKRKNQVIGNEGYVMSVNPDNIIVKANSASGIFYGLQSLLQLLPPSIESDSVIKNTRWTIPCVEITDYPRFGWRGLMLDVARHFFTKQEVMAYIDQMVKYKYNTLHLHLSDDQGWRVEIKSLPQLTNIGAWRVERTGRFDTFSPAFANEPATYGGFYTQDDIREIVEYAAKRYVTILPEIDVPAHSLALIASFPNLSCTGKQYSVDPGTDFYTHKLADNVLCIGNDSVFIVLDKILTELAGMFPCKYIHIGGDEAYKGFWDQCPKCRQRMKDENLKNTDELQSYFIKRVEKILKSKGKQLIGWDEILDGGLAPEATVMSWRGSKGGIAAATMQHNVVMCPWSNCYLDLYQGDPSAEPPTYGICRLSDTYNFEPVPEGVNEKYILGGQGNLWTESVPNIRQAEYMTWPRGMALAEVYWSSKKNKNWDWFIQKMEDHFLRLDAADVKYSRSTFNAVVTPRKTWNDEIAVTLSTEVKGLSIYYSFDNTFPDKFYPLYKEGEILTFPKGSDHINVITYLNNKEIGQRLCISKQELENRATE
jgi:hexosaminidase